MFPQGHRRWLGTGMSRSVTVTIDHDHLLCIDDLAHQLRTAGMHVDQVLDAVGVITGSVTDDQRSVISRLPGVAGIEDQNMFRLPPPDSDIQ